MKRQKKNGFTIIEVVLVLGIAGMIFMMVFVALPQMRRSQRDSERKDDVMLMVEAIKKYQSNNRGTLPTGSGVASRPADSGSDKTSWASFYHDYLEEKYEDPNGESYRLTPHQCSGNNCGVNVSFDYTMHIVIQGKCDGDHAIQSSNPRDFAVLYHTESSGVYCYNS